MAIAKDASSPAVKWGTQQTGGSNYTLASASFSPPANSLVAVLALVGYYSANYFTVDGLTCADSGANSYTEAVTLACTANGNYGAGSIFWRYYSSAPGSITVSVTLAAAETDVAGYCLDFLPVVLTGCASSQSGAGTASGAQSNANISLSSSSASSWCLVAAGGYQTGTVTGTGLAATWASSTSDAVANYGEFGYAAPGATGAHTMGWTSADAGGFGVPVLALEILPSGATAVSSTEAPRATESVTLISATLSSTEAVQAAELGSLAGVPKSDTEAARATELSALRALLSGAEAARAADAQSLNTGQSSFSIVYPSLPGGATNGSVPGSSTDIGIQFSITQDGYQLSGYYVYVAPGGTTTGSSYTFALYSTTNGTSGTLVTGSSLTGSGTLTAGAWNYLALATPVALTNGTTYVAAYHFAANILYEYLTNYWSSGGGSGGVTNGPISAPNSANALANVQQGYNQPAGGSIAFPTSVYNSTWYGIDVNITSVSGGASKSDTEAQQFTEAASISIPVTAEAGRAAEAQALTGLPVDGEAPRAAEAQALQATLTAAEAGRVTEAQAVSTGSAPSDSDAAQAAETFATAAGPRADTEMAQAAEAESAAPVGVSYANSWDFARAIESPGIAAGPRKDTETVSVIDAQAVNTGQAKSDAEAAQAVEGIGIAAGPRKDTETAAVTDVQSPPTPRQYSLIRTYQRA